MVDLLFFLILGHYVGDFALQTDNMALQKLQSAAALSCHVAVYVGTMAVFLAIGLYFSPHGKFLSGTTLLILASIFVAHWLQDYIKGRWFAHSKQAYYIDQTIHLAVLYIVRLTAYHG